MPSRVDCYTPSAGDEASRRASQRVDALNRDPRFRRLDTATRQQAMQLVQVNRRNPRAAENIRALVTSDGFAQLNEKHRRELLNALARAPGDARYAEDLRAFANSPEIRHLGDSAKSTLIGQLSLQNANDDTRNTLLSSPNRARLDAMLPALAGLPPQEQFSGSTTSSPCSRGCRRCLGPHAAHGRASGDRLDHRRVKSSPPSSRRCAPRASAAPSRVLRLPMGSPGSKPERPAPWGIDEAEHRT